MVCLETKNSDKRLETTKYGSQRGEANSKNVFLTLTLGLRICVVVAVILQCVRDLPSLYTGNKVSRISVHPCG